MFVNDKLIFVQFEKTGCTHIKRLLHHFMGGTQFDKHSRIPDDYRHDGKLVVGSVRNPWDWYVSMWSYGCLGEGSLYHDLTAPAKILGHGYRKEPIAAVWRLLNSFLRIGRNWKGLYGDAKDPELFRRWLRMIHSPQNRHDLMDQYADSPISRYAGFYTYRYTRLFCRHLNALYAPEMARPENLRRLLDNGILLDVVVRNEHLEDDFIRALALCGMALDSEQIGFIRSTYKTNPSERERRTGFYYDQDTMELVRDRDRFLIEKYGFEAPAPD